MVEELLRGGGLRVGAYLSPHVRSWAERIRVDGAEADLEAALADGSARRGAARGDAVRGRSPRPRFVAFRAAGVEAAAVEAGLGGRHDATNVLDETRVVVLTNVSLEHTEVLGDDARGDRGREARGDPPRLRGRPRRAGVGGACAGRGRGRRASSRRAARTALAAAAASAFLGRPVDATARGRASRFPAGSSAGRARSATARTTPTASGGSSSICRPDDYTVMASILADKDVDAMLAALAAVGRRFVACRSSNPRALPADELAGRARRPLRASSRRATTRATRSSSRTRSASRCS